MRNATDPVLSLLKTVFGLKTFSFDENMAKPSIRMSVAA
jgi:hypothetical protein